MVEQQRHKTNFWYMQYMSNGTKEIVNLNSNQCLTTDGVAGDNVYQVPCEGLLGQEWYTDFPPHSIFLQFLPVREHAHRVVWT